MKRNLGFLAVGILILYLIFSGYLKIQSYVIGVYTKLNVSQAEVRDAQRFWREYLARYDDLTDYQRRELEKRKIEYEIKFLNALEPFVEALEDANQVGG